MRKRAEYAWRFAATAGCLAVFYASSVAMIMFVLPVVRIVIRDRMTRYRRVRWIINEYFLFFVRLMILAGVIRVAISGEDRLKDRSSRVVIANHPSYLDIVILLSRVPNACCIVNSNLLANPFIGRLTTAAGYVYNTTDSDQVVNDCVRALEQGCPLIIFPEGTRSAPGKAYAFHRGFAHIVLKSGADIQPVTIRCEPSMLAKGVPWYRIPERRAAFLIQAHPKIKPSDVVDMREEPAIAARALTRYFEERYSKERG